MKYQGSAVCVSNCTVVNINAVNGNFIHECVHSIRRQRDNETAVVFICSEQKNVNI